MLLVSWSLQGQPPPGIADRLFKRMNKKGKEPNPPVGPWVEGPEYYMLTTISTMIVCLICFIYFFDDTNTTGSGWRITCNGYLGRFCEYSMYFFIVLLYI